MTLALRSFAELVRRAQVRTFTGDLVVREGDGTEHRVVFRSGVVVDVRIFGRFDPILKRLLDDGALTESLFVATLEGLGRTRRRAGDLALDAGVPRTALQDALRAQGERRLRALSSIVRGRGREAFLSPRPVRASEVAFRLDPTRLVHPADGAPPPKRRPVKAPTKRGSRDRRALRRLAFALHPDRHPHLSDAEREVLARRLASATAEFHER